MTARIAPEPIAIGVTSNPMLAHDIKKSARPVEPIEQSTADPKGNDSRDDRQAEADPLSRPPGKDPSIPPQALFDAALIAAENKPSVKPIESTPKPVAAEVSTEAAQPANDPVKEVSQASSDVEGTENTEAAENQNAEEPTFAYFGTDRESTAV